MSGIQYSQNTRKTLVAWSGTYPFGSRSKRETGNAGFSVLDVPSFTLTIINHVIAVTSRDPGRMGRTSVSIITHTHISALGVVRKTTAIVKTGDTVSSRVGGIRVERTVVESACRGRVWNGTPGVVEDTLVSFLLETWPAVYITDCIVTASILAVRVVPELVTSRRLVSHTSVATLVITKNTVNVINGIVTASIFAFRKVPKLVTAWRQVSDASLTALVITRNALTIVKVVVATTRRNAFRMLGAHEIVHARRGRRRNEKREKGELHHPFFFFWAFFYL